MSDFPKWLREIVAIFFCDPPCLNKQAHTASIVIQKGETVMKYSIAMELHMTEEARARITRIMKKDNLSWSEFMERAIALMVRADESGELIETSTGTHIKVPFAVKSDTEKEQVAG